MTKKNLSYWAIRFYRKLFVKPISSDQAYKRLSIEEKNNLYYKIEFERTLEEKERIVDDNKKYRNSLFHLERENSLLSDKIREYAEIEKQLSDELGKIGFEINDIKEVPERIKLILDLDKFRQELVNQRVSLNEERRELRQAFLKRSEELNTNFRLETELREEQLSQAWIKFNAIKRKEFVNAISEINKG